MATAGPSTAAPVGVVVAPDWASYKEWATSQGIRLLCDVDVCQLPDPYDRGLVAGEDIAANKVVLTVPQALLLTIHTANTVGYPLNPVLDLSKELELREDDILALTLIYEKFVRVRAVLACCWWHHAAHISGLDRAYTPLRRLAVRHL